MVRRSKKNTKSRCDRRRRRLVWGVAAGTMTLGLVCASVLAQTPIQLEDAKLLASDGAAIDRFGWSVSISGEVAVVAAFLDDDNGTDSGSAYVFRFNGFAWVEEAKLLPSDGAASDGFGYSVSISGDVAVVGALGDDENATNSGSAYVFAKPPGGWVDMTQTAKLTASDGAANDLFGASVSVSGDVAIVGSPRDDDNGFDSGSAYVFVRPPGGWVNVTQTAKLTASDGAANDQFGDRVEISGNVVVLGSSLDDDNGFDSGSAYVFVKPPGGWVDMTQTAKLTASDGAVQDQFGFSVSISGDMILVGALADDDNGFDSGSAYVFVKPPGGWVDMTQTAKLTASDGAAVDLFARSVSISGEVAVVGAYLDDDNGVNSGSAYIFRFDGTEWIEEAKLTASDAAAADEFGFSVSISGDVAVVGAELGDGNVADSGSAYVFALAPLDSDGDGLTDAEEAVLGTDPNNPDTDGDGLDDFTEVDTAVNGCPDPLTPDSDGDTLLDGAEVALGTDPCNPDSDGDGVDDGTDPTPLDPGVPPGFLEGLVRTLSGEIRGLDTGLFNGPNPNANRGRRNALANRARGAANDIAAGDFVSAIDKLESLLAKIDGEEPPPDWMDDSAAKTSLAIETQTLIALLVLL